MGNLGPGTVIAGAAPRAILAGAWLVDIAWR
jgi:hypothetical protein